MFAIACNRGEICCGQYEGLLNGELFSGFTRKHFPQVPTQRPNYFLPFLLCASATAISSVCRFTSFLIRNSETFMCGFC